MDLPKPHFGSTLNYGHWSTDRLVGFWPFSPAGTLIDLTFFKRFGDRTGTTWGGDRLTFDGTSDYVHHPGHAGIDNMTEFTAIVKIKGNSAVEGTNLTIVNKGQFSGWILNAFWDTFNQQIKAHVDYDDTDADSVSTNNAFVLKDTEAVIAICLTGTTIKLYYNGEEVTYATQTSGIGARVSESGNELVFGARDVSFDRFFPGDMFYSLLYSRALSANEIKQLYLNPFLPVRDDLIVTSSFTPAVGDIPIFMHHYKMLRAS